MKSKRAKKKKVSKPTAAAADSDAWQWITRQQAAKLMQCTVATVGNMINDGRLFEKSGLVDLETVVDVIRGKSERDKQRGEDAESRARAAREQEMNIRFREAKTQTAVMELEARRGKFISKMEARRDMVAAMTIVRSGLKSWVSTLSEKLAGLDVRETAATLDVETDQILNAMSDTMERTARDADKVEGRVAV